jgi:hypothetical protein
MTPDTSATDEVLNEGLIRQTTPLLAARQHPVVYGRDLYAGVTFVP